MMKAVLFDLDDTLYAEIDYVKSGFRHCAGVIAEETGVPKEAALAELSNLFNSDRAGVFNRFALRHGLSDAICELCILEYRNHMPALSLSAEATEILSLLRAAGMRLGLVTDGRPEGQRAKVAALGLEPLVDAVVITDELGGPAFRKPCSAGYELALQKIDVPAISAAYVGDNPSKDFIAPNRMGMLTIRYVGIRGFYGERPSPDGGAAKLEIGDLRELAMLLRREVER